MSHPTPLSPWFVIMRLENTDELAFYTEDGEQYQFDEDRAKARLFNSLHTAYRLAAANGAYVVALADEAALKEFRPKGI